MAYQESLLKEKRDLLAARRQEIEEYILIQVEKIRTEYQEELKNFQEKLEGQYQEFVQTKEEEYLEQVLVKKELYTENFRSKLENWKKISWQNWLPIERIWSRIFIWPNSIMT